MGLGQDIVDRLEVFNLKLQADDLKGTTVTKIWIHEGTVKSVRKEISSSEVEHDRDPE